MNSLLGCGEKIEVHPDTIESDMNSITDEGINALANKKIIFGHMSVGNNISAGIEDIKDASHRFKKINIKQLGIDELIDAPGIYSIKVGNNGFPEKKCDVFKKRLMEDRFGKRIDIAFFKFCFVDFKEKSDVKDIFNRYVETIASLKKEFPELITVHVTTPLKIHAWGAQGIIENILKGKIENVRRGLSCIKKNLTKGDIENTKRNEFNKMLINKYKDKDPIYDLAKAESTLPNGERVTFKHKDRVYLSLAREYTSDGGHLNKLGRYYAAKELLETLSEISVK
jgi:hypothetical protein